MPLLILDNKRQEGKLIPRTLATLALTCIIVLTILIAASATGFVVTEPGMLIGLGIAFVTVGAGTRQMFRSQRRKA